MAKAGDRDDPLSGDRRDMLLGAGLVLAAELSLPVALQRIVELAVRVTGARYGALAVLDQDGCIAQLVTAGLSDAERQAIEGLPRGRSILAALIDEGRPLRLRRIADDPRSAGLPPGHPPVSSFLGVPVKAMGRAYGSLYLAEKQGGDEFDQPDEDALVVLATHAGVAVANAHLYEQSQRHGTWLEAQAEVSGMILSGAEPGIVLPLVGRYARLIAGGATAAVIMPREGDADLVVSAADGEGADRLLGLRVPRDRSVAGTVIRTATTLVIDDASDDDMVLGAAIAAADLGPLACVPLRAGGRPCGGLWISRRRGGPTFGDEVVRLLETFAAQASIALEYGRAQSELGRLLLLEERERIARELHDGIIQALFAVGMGLQGTAAMVGRGEAGHRIEEAVGELDRVIRDLRNYIFGLRPGILADRQLDQALRSLAREFEVSSGVPTTADVDPEAASLLASQAGAVVQMAREGLSNVARHADAMRCRLSLDRERRLAVLTVEDDGVGFDQSQPRPDGHGLDNLRDRARSLGGDLRVTSHAGQGTTIRIELPL